MTIRAPGNSLALLPWLARWTLLSAAVALLAGSASALFLFALDQATETRTTHAWLLWLLPVAGFTVAWIYLRVGAAVEAGNKLLLEEILAPRQVVPLRMAPMILVATVISHLFGASVGREGTAVQMGGALADQLSRPFRLDESARRMLLLSGIAAGFASVFGTPLAGAVFALEVVAIGRLRAQALYPCVLAAVLADQVGLAWGAQHTHYAIGALPAPGLMVLGMLLVAGVVFGLVARGFVGLNHAASDWMKQRLPWPPVRAFAGGAVIALLAWALPLEPYLGLGIPGIVQAFEQPLPAHDFAAKAALTIASLASGFKGGEVTPLFWIGATLGNALAPLLELPLGLLAGMGFVAVFAGAAKTPLASTVMAMELFGAPAGLFAAIACLTSRAVSGPIGLYRVQHAKEPKRLDTTSD